MKNKKGQEKGALSSTEKREFVRSPPRPPFRETLPPRVRK